MKKLPALFYRSAAGNELVRDWLNGPELEEHDRRVIGKDVAKAEYGWPVGMPTCEHLGGGLYVIRSNLRNNRVTRVIFSIEEGQMVLLHGFMKKSTDGIKTPPHEIKVAADRRRELLQRRQS